ncbi:SDR family NAD(P)-dependent oxidoreductase [Streptomyces sp. RY43-2]|uniref:SDR family NAD(P)-dependent oxidoreductase n=1 Tax=Streptomyces macrolidinus TaxID=2952607 RepID=A0ABT0ZJK3_9ACTN|nr:SDR family NAD(P)-dependent oxidoreductase [Streptomyces macrolidinus]MCN9243736.1 SDR family NAD(P)-dependent oxidoreductase [Streptomyces macrolidinus]
MTDLSDRTIFLTGATDGLGRAVAEELAFRGATLILHGRSRAKGDQLLAELCASTGNRNLSYETADFSCLKEIQNLATRLPAHGRLDTLVNNAGMGVELQRRESQEGHELTFQVDYLACYILSARLAPILARNAPARIINVTSAGQAAIDFDDIMLRQRWSGEQAYCQAKLAQIMFTFDLAATLENDGVTVNALHPASYMPTKIVTPLYTPQSSVAEGVENLLRLIEDPRYAHRTGRYLNRADETRAHYQAYDEEARLALRSTSAALTGTPFPRTAPAC